ncbi:hypothetical protein PoB_007264000 [Plakobranchus ocellatus]|uniref:Uncharacterized protein n=1 Tax=Plakobranchus ocellatus TaxID=259542 RepID=A0AAV4DPS1_9GAST|nr:hypothetical protein PoB_007264000 [Plakobranchus ocellatus]
MRGHLMAPSFSLSNRATDIRPGSKAQRVALTLRQDESRSRLVVLSHQRNRVFSNIYCEHVNTAVSSVGFRLEGNKDGCSGRQVYSKTAEASLSEDGDTESAIEACTV